MLEHPPHKILISEKEIEEIVVRLAGEINRDYKDLKEELVVIGLLKGSFVFIADLIRKLKIPILLDFMTVSSYDGGTVNTEVKVVMDLGMPITGRDILIIEDIIDTGYTFNKVIELVNSKGPKSLKICALLSKPSRRKKEVKIDYLGTEIPDEFVIGYGLDYKQKYRYFPYIGIIDPEEVGA